MDVAHWLTRLAPTVEDEDIPDSARKPPKTVEGEEGEAGQSTAVSDIRLDIPDSALTIQAIQFFQGGSSSPVKKTPKKQAKKQVVDDDDEEDVKPKRPGQKSDSEEDVKPQRPGAEKASKVVEEDKAVDSKPKKVYCRLHHTCITLATDDHFFIESGKPVARKEKAKPKPKGKKSKKESSEEESADESEEEAVSSEEESPKKKKKSVSPARSPLKIKGSKQLMTHFGTRLSAVTIRMRETETQMM